MSTTSGFSALVVTLSPVDLNFTFRFTVVAAIKNHFLNNLHICLKGTDGVLLLYLLLLLFAVLIYHLTVPFDCSKT